VEGGVLVDAVVEEAAIVVPRVEVVDGGCDGLSPNVSVDSIVLVLSLNSLPELVPLTTLLMLSLPAAAHPLITFAIASSQFFRSQLCSKHAIVLSTSLPSAQ
jgi:hypothetical protein